jgi:hypothetical protein
MAVAAFLLAAAAAPAQILDRIAVTVGKSVILESEVLTYLRVAAFLDQKEPDLTGPSKRKAADQLVDQALLRTEVPWNASAESVMEAVAQIKKQFPSEAAFQSALKQYRITENDIALQLANGVESVDATNRRFGPEVQVSDDDLRTRYNQLVEDWRAKKVSDIPSFDASRGQLQELMMSERVSDALDKWLDMTRQQITIRYREDVFR